MKNRVFLSFVCFVALGWGLTAQDAPPAAPAADAVPQVVPDPAPSAEPAATAPGERTGQAETAHYIVRSDLGAEDAKALATRLEAYLETFNSYFRFDTSREGLKFKVKVYGDKFTYDKYLTRLINETRNDYVYLHYSDSTRSELVGYATQDYRIPESSLVHQAFIQYLRTFVPNPPLWIREGFAVYFEALTFDVASGKVVPAQNLAWLETWKELSYGSRTAEALDMDTLMTLGVEDARTKINVFYPQAWGLVNYLAQGETKEHNRILWDAIRVLDPAATLLENSQAVLRQAFGWETRQNLAAAETAYFKAKKTFRELVLEGIDLYAAGKRKDAEADFTKALALQSGNHIPYYYLGLINYENANYGKAADFYKEALAKGADAVLTNYALGVNAYADNQFEDAASFLKKVLELDASYATKVQELMDRMEV